MNRLISTFRKILIETVGKLDSLINKNVRVYILMYETGDLSTLIQNKLQPSRTAINADDHLKMNLFFLFYYDFPSFN